MTNHYPGKGGTADIRERVASAEQGGGVPVLLQRMKKAEETISENENYDPGDLEALFLSKLI